MLSPKKTKYRKRMRGVMKGNATRCNTINFGECGLVALDTHWITARQIEAARIAMTRHIKRGWKSLDQNFPRCTLYKETR